MLFVSLLSPARAQPPPEQSRYHLRPAITWMMTLALSITSVTGRVTCNLLGHKLIVMDKFPFLARELSSGRPGGDDELMCVVDCDAMVPVESMAPPDSPDESWFQLSAGFLALCWASTLFSVSFWLVLGISLMCVTAGDMYVYIYKHTSMDV